MNTYIYKNLNRRTLLATLLLVHGWIFLISCASSGSLWGLDPGELTEKLEDDSFLNSLSQNQQKIPAEIEQIPGAGWYIGQMLNERGKSDLAALFLEAQYDLSDPIYSTVAFEHLLRLLLRSGQYQRIVTITGNHRGQNHKEQASPDLRTEAWFYTHRFESLIQLGMANKAYTEMTSLLNEHSELFASEHLPHGLLYYRALSASLAADPRDMDAHILPYALVSNARFGHREVYESLGRTLGENAKLLRAYPWLESKILLMDDDADRSVDVAFRLLEKPDASFFMLAAHRPDEGISLDLFVAGMDSRKKEEVQLLFQRLAALIPSTLPNGDLLEARYLEYAGRLLGELRQFDRAAVVLERSFRIIQKLREELSVEELSAATTDRGAGNTEVEAEVGALALLSRRQEQVLWRWVTVLLADIHSPPDDYSAISLIRNPDYFYDLSDDYLSRLLRSQKLETLASFIRNAGDRIPPALRTSIIHILEALAKKNERAQAALSTIERAAPRPASPPASSGAAPRPASPPASLLSQELLSIKPAINKGTLAELFAPERSVPYSISALSAGTVSLEDIRAFTQIVHGYALFGLYRDAAEYLAALPPGYSAEPWLVLDMVHRAYNEEDWYGGLSIIETAIARSFRYRDGPEGLVDAAGGEDELFKLLFPTAWFEQVEGFAADYDINPYFFLSLMREESRFNARAGSTAGALGLAQIIPQTAEDIAARMRLDNYDLFDPNDNIQMALFYLSYLSSRFSTLWEILAAYNAGQGRVDRWNRELPSDELPGFYYASHVPYAETRRYMSRVLHSFLIYNYLYCETDNYCGTGGAGNYGETGGTGNEEPRRGILHEVIVPQQRAGG